jgi:hypothetical protein
MAGGHNLCTCWHQVVSSGGASQGRSAAGRPSQKRHQISNIIFDVRETGCPMWLKTVSPHISGGHRVLGGIGMAC